MLSFSAVLLLNIYLGAMAILLLISLGHLWHAIRFGGLNPLSIFTSGLFIAGVIVIAWGSTNMLSQVDWSSTFHINLPSLHFFSFG